MIRLAILAAIVYTAYRVIDRASEENRRALLLPAPSAANRAVPNEKAAKIPASPGSRSAIS